MMSLTLQHYTSKNKIKNNSIRPNTITLKIDAKLCFDNHMCKSNADEYTNVYKRFVVLKKKRYVL